MWRGHRRHGAVIRRTMHRFRGRRRLTVTLGGLHKRPHGLGDGLTRLHDAKSFDGRRSCRARRQDVET
jgi:hypothetical protein